MAKEFTIENEYLKVTVTTWGAQVKSVLRKCDGVEHIWQADPTLWGYHAPILFQYMFAQPEKSMCRMTETVRTVPNFIIYFLSWKAKWY